MFREMLKSKIHRATVTGADLRYQGSITIDPALMAAADLLVGEKVLVVDIDCGSRFETYVIEGKPGEICLNGAAARLGQIGDKVIVMAFCLVDDAEARSFKPRILLVNEHNAVTGTGI